MFIPMSTPTAPTFDEHTATPVTPYRHSSGRTVARHQPAGDKQTHLFSATGSFIATVSEPKAVKPAAQ